MAHDIVRLSQDLFGAIAARLHKGGIGIGYMALRIRHRHQGGIVWENIFVLGDRQIATHAKTLQKEVLELKIWNLIGTARQNIM
ncbi:hypothetical protein ABK905_00350 [Acerihabitans sp. KWT182]|uniref:Uncharacterized protein n=1 Tax=Acerihabitans sp. KWT182 TaxID=3157919 RepID=A0AAU7QG09_9GAMM